MKKLVVLPYKRTKYSKVISEIGKLGFEDIIFIAEKEINLKFIKKFDIVIFENLTKQLQKRIHHEKIILINICKYSKYNKLIDICIDPFFKITKNNTFNPSRGIFMPIQQDLSNLQEFKNLLNVITIMDWDSKFWKKKICFIGPKRLTNNIIFRCNKFIKNNKIQMIQFLSHCHDPQTVTLAEKNNFGFKDIRITLEKKIDFNSKIKVKKKNISFRKATLRDLKFIKPIAENSYLESRYFFDILFSTKSVKIFYANWLKKSILGTFDSFCLLICFKKKPIGFCTLKVKNQNATIGLFSISKKYQRKGFSQSLLSFVSYELSRLKISSLSVVTQGRNYSALKAYQSNNFKISRTELWYHKWTDRYNKIN
jgi:dTDP-4-amino-4,6-dideoxy-D-galactose acyltransferase